ncbi:MAG: hypothetical protein JNL90_04260 [Planctomycetes bacterium]|nr:hypothetical protein [Planctomycetota bacterium]
MAIQGMFAFGEEPSLSVTERIAAASHGVQRGAGGVDLTLLQFASFGFALLLVGVLVWWMLRGVKQRQWIAVQAQRLAHYGLHKSEIELFHRVAEAARGSTVPLLSRQRGVFDAAAAELLAATPPGAPRRELLEPLLVLRRRLPFEARLDAAPTFVRGAAVQLWLRIDDGEPQRIRASVMATLPHALQLGIEFDKLPPPLDAALQAGQELMLVVLRDRVLEESRVRIRGRTLGRTLQLLVDRPAVAVPSRVRLGWRGADEPVRIELVERFNERVVGDSIPVVKGRVVATANDGLLLDFESIRPRHGEAIRLMDGACAGFYRGFATLDPKGRGGSVFVLRRSSERTDAHAAAKERESDATVAHA